MIKIGIGPSSSHTMGPWKATEDFLTLIRSKNNLNSVVKVKVQLFGSLAKTGKGHCTDIAVLLGLSGYDYTTIDTGLIPKIFNEIKSSKKIFLGAEIHINFDCDHDLIFTYNETLPFHPNGLKISAEFSTGEKLEQKYYSIGGGFIVTEESSNQFKTNNKTVSTPYPCHTGKAILENCKKLNLRVSDLVMLNETTWRSESDIRNLSLKIWDVMLNSIYRGVHKTGVLPGGLNVKRRAPEINKKLLHTAKYSNIQSWFRLIKSSERNFTTINKWISCFALAVNEENADLGRIVTAPTNGAAGVLPAVLMYAWCFTDNFGEEQVIRFILTAGEIATIFKKNATISAAMGGCQAEIGVSSAMAAAALTECLGGTPEQVLMSGEIAMEHHLGLTCDPVAGLVQIPCIERNSMGAIKAITAANLALESDPKVAKVSLDDVIKSMWETAKDMNTKYKETSEGGLAVNIPIGLAEC